MLDSVLDGGGGGQKEREGENEVASTMRTYQNRKPRTTAAGAAAIAKQNSRELGHKRENNEEGD